MELLVFFIGVFLGMGVVAYDFALAKGARFIDAYYTVIRNALSFK